MEKGAKQAKDGSGELCIMKETIAKRLSQPARCLANRMHVKKGGRSRRGIGCRADRLNGISIHVEPSAVV